MYEIEVSFEMGAEGIVPYLNIFVNDATIELFGFLNDRDVLHLITWMRDAVGAVLIMCCIIKVILGIPDILNGRFNFGGIEYTDSLENGKAD